MSPFNFFFVRRRQPSTSTSSSSETLIPKLQRPEYGIWKCCHCQNDNHIHIRSDNHPISTVSCECPHKPCDNCRFSGSLKQFLPINEPLLIPLEDQRPGEGVPYGVVCDGCGLSWRAEELREAPAIMKMKDFHKHRLTASEGRLRKSQSLMNLIAGQGKEKPKEKDAKSTSIKFTGLKCTCGCPLDPIPDAEPAAESQGPQRNTNQELLAKGHHDETIRVLGIEHPNPLRVNPSKPEGLN